MLTAVADLAPCPVGAMPGFEERVAGLHARLAVVCGGLNALHAELSGLVAEAVDGGLWELGGIVSPEHWLQWQTGLSASRARSLIAVARRHDLPVCTAAFDAGQLSVDQMTVVARHAPNHNDAEIRDFALAATVSQLSHGLAAYADVTVTPAQGPVDTVTCGFDGDRFTLRASGPAAQGQIVRHALCCTRSTKPAAITSRWPAPKATSSACSRRPTVPSGGEALTGEPGGEIAQRRQFGEVFVVVDLLEVPQQLVRHMHRGAPERHHR